MVQTPLKRFKRQALWLLTAIFFALTYFAARNLVEKYDDRANARLIHAWTETSLSVNHVVHELQKERGLSSGLISSHGRYFDVVLKEQRKATDRAIAALLAALEKPAGQAEPLAQSVRLMATAFEQLPQLRERIAALSVSRDVAVDRYSTLIESLFEPQLVTMSIGRVGWIYRQQMAYIFFLQAKEMAGQERALLTAMLSANDFSAMRMMAYYRIKAVEAARLEKFVQLADAAVLADYLAIEASAFVQEAEKIRRRVAAVGASGRAPDNHMPGAGKWFDLSTQRIDAMSGFEKRLSDHLMASAIDLEQEAHWALWVNALTVLISLALAGGLLLQIWRGKEYAEKNLHLAQAVFDNSVEAIIIADAHANIVEVNQAFTRITGYTRDEVLGQNPRIMKSGRHDRDFYHGMWLKIGATGSWEGEIWNRRKNGDIYPALLSIVAVYDAKESLVNFIAMTVDLSKYKETEALLEQLRTFDLLTGLPNRDAWHSTVDQAVVNAKRNDSRFTILDIGLDRFRLINESLGHAVGDQVLMAAGEHIKHLLRRHDIAARPGGDRFSILLTDMDDAPSIATFCERILAAFAAPIEAQGQPLTLSVSIGVAIYPGDGGDTRTLLKNAETALHGAKEEGRACYAFYARAMNAAGAQLLTLERLLRQALANGEFAVVYQPQVDARSKQLIGVEALLRWKNPQLGNVSPVQFIPIAEATGLIVPIGEWVLRESCQQASRWHRQLGLAIPVAVNLSARQFRREDLMITVQMALDDYALPAHLLELEITEGLLMADPAGAAVIMDGLRHMGLKIALDDFGTGYSSLAYLKNFPLDRLKLDRAFVKDLPDNESDKAIARAVIALGLNLGLQTLAEGVETSAQADFLAAAGCEVFQGYLYGKPMPAEELEAKIRTGEFTVYPG
ncbi:MAG: EAL domain-containing protein [Rhodocyclaceae bacterium]|nr:EAL domain-containing protein [Rhodocyclaceae bacterium]MDZ4215332.1 EAL domain-containing protein [Rhodocyclaceae bacterium]